MLLNSLLLMGVFAQETFLHDELHIRLLNLQIGITISYVTKHISSELEFWCLIYQLLHTKYHTEFRAIGHMTKCLQYLKVAS